MSVLTGEIWVCAGCRSINGERDEQCYNCRTPRDVAGVDPETIDAAGTTEIRPLDVPPYRPSRGVATIASILILAIAGIQIIHTFMLASLIVQIIGGVDPTPEQERYIANLGTITLGVAALALIGWSLWLSRVITSMPSLGLGEPPVDGLRAFVENFIPGLNLYRVPSFVRDIVHRLDPGTIRGEALIFAAWIGLLVGFFLPRVAGYFLLADASPDAAKRAELILGVVSTVAVVLGALFLVALIWWVEDRMARRRASQLAQASATQLTVVGGTAMTGAAVAEAAMPEEAVTATATPGPATATPGTTTLADRVATTQAATPPSAETQVGGSRWNDVRPFSLPRLEPQPEPHPSAPGPAVDEPAAVVPPEAPPAVEGPAVAEPVTQTPVTVEPAVEQPVVAEAPPVAGAPSTPEAPAPEAPVAETPPPATPEPDVPAAAAAAVDDRAETNGEAPRLTIRVGSRGLMTAEMDGEAEPVILEDLSEYAAALATAGGSARLWVREGDDMAQLVGRRVRRILEEADVTVSDD